MKKLIVTLAIILGMGMTTFAQDAAFGGGGLFQRGETSYNYLSDWADLGWLGSGALVGLPSDHGFTTDQPAPLGTGIAVLLGLGGAYLVAKRRKEE